MFFLSCDITNGDILAELPLKISGSITRALSTITQAGFELSVRDPRCPSDWQALIDPYRVWIAAIDDAGCVLWAGIPQVIVTQATSEIVKITCVSPEAYLARRYVPTRTFTQQDQTSVIARWLVERAVAHGLPFGFDTPVSGVKRDRAYYADDSATVLKRLEELGAVQNGFEWMIDTRLRADQSGIESIFTTGYPRIGIATDSPQAVFEMPGGLLEATVETRWGEGDAATLVLAKGSGEGEDTPFSAPSIAETVEGAGIPRLEMVKSFTSVKEKSTLDAHAARLLSRYQYGTQVLSLRQRLAAYPQPGIDFNLGDDVRLVVDTDTVTVDKKFRCVGWQIDQDLETITPIVADFGGA